VDGDDRLVVLFRHIDAEHAPALRVGRRGATALHTPEPHTREGTPPYRPDLLAERLAPNGVAETRAQRTPATVKAPGPPFPCPSR
jgi:hypothetical protein